MQFANGNGGAWFSPQAYMDLANFYESMGRSAPTSVGLPNGGRPKYVKFAPGDKGDHLPAVFFEDPRTFKPEPGPRGQIHAWGLYPYDYDGEPDVSEKVKMSNLPAFDGVQAMFRQMSSQMIYHGPNGLPSPEHQFMKVLLDRKRQQLSALDLGGLEKHDVILKITIAVMDDSAGQPRVWRRFRLSAGIKLSAFQDKAVAPIMGWVRNFHCYTFTDYRDGALFGPEGASSVDIAHIAQVGYKYLPDDKYMLAHLFSKEGDQIGYLYDFGDKWHHVIEIERILPLEESDGSIKIIDGKGMCPGENMRGSLQYEDFLNDLDAAPYAKKQKMKREVLECPNYKDFGKPPALFDPALFDLQATTDRLAAALASTNSVRSGAKKFTMPMGGMGNDALREQLEKMHLKEGQSIKQVWQPENHGFWEETTSNTKDRRRETVCAACGKPGGAELKTCSGCRQILYCSVEHQRAHWKTVHKDQCSRVHLSKKSTK